MEFDRSDALFLSNLFFYIKNSSVICSFDKETTDNFEYLYLKIHNHLSENLNSTAKMRASNQDPDEYDEEEEQLPETDSFLTVDKFAALGKFSVLDQGVKRTLGFVVSAEGGLDVELDDGNEILTDISGVKRSGSTLEVFFDGNWRSFFVKKFPKKFTALIEIGTTFGVEEAA